MDEHIQPPFEKNYHQSYYKYLLHVSFLMRDESLGTLSTMLGSGGSQGQRSHRTKLVSSLPLPQLELNADLAQLPSLRIRKLEVVLQWSQPCLVLL